jgi:CYTH domain-containing protein
LIEQGYLAVPHRDANEAEVRVRRVNEHYVVTVKKGRGESRLEKEVAIPSASGRQLWPLTKGRRVKKVRYTIPYRRLTIELDVYRDAAKGLAIAEVEFDSAAAARRFDPPPWFGDEVTGRKRFANSELARTGWKKGRRAGAPK